MFCSTRKLPSSRWQTRYLDDQGTRRTAPQTFVTKREADDWLATARADLLRGTYRSPDAGRERLSDYLADWLTTDEAGMHGSPRLVRRSILQLHQAPRSALAMSTTKRDGP
jgi:hypothetical protein